MVKILSKGATVIPAAIPVFLIKFLLLFFIIDFGYLV
jgi:hypothetical protein